MKKIPHGLKAVSTRRLEGDDLFETLGLIFQYVEHFVMISGASKPGFFSSVRCVTHAVQPPSCPGLGASRRGELRKGFSSRAAETKATSPRRCLEV